MTRTAIITGGSRGLGKALAEQLVAEVWVVVVDGRDEKALRVATVGGVQAIPGDVTDPGHRRALVEAARQTGRLDLLVNNASTLGASPLPRVSEIPPELLQEIYDVNVVAPLALIEESLDLLRSSRGTIINVTSDAARVAYEGWGGYGSSKAALEQLSNVLAAEEPTVRVWWLDPGDMRTRMHQDAFPGEDISDRPEPETVVPAIVTLLAKRPPSGRIQAAEYAGLASA